MRNFHPAKARNDGTRFVSSLYGAFAMDLEHDKIYPLNKAPFPGNPSVPTRWRWRLKGINGIRLETFNVGSRPFVTKIAIERFIEQVTAARSGVPTSLRSPAKRDRDIRRAEQELAKAGV
jgi:hypothetical protein